MSTISFNMYDKIDESMDVSKLLGVPFPIKLCNLRILWEAGFGIYNLYCVEDGNDYDAGMWLCTSTKFLPHKLTVGQYNLWLSILYQISKIPVLISAFAEESSVNSYVANSLYKRSLCCISAQRESNKVEKNVKDHKELGDSLRKLGYFPIQLKGIFYEQDDKGNTIHNDEGELSYLVISRKGEDIKSFNKNMFDLGVKYNQDSILMRDADVEEAYYWGTSHTDNPSVFKPGFNKKSTIGVLLPYKSTGFGYTPINPATGRLEDKDAFAYHIPQVDGDLPELNTDFPWTRVEKNIYKNNAGTFKFVVSKNNVLHYGYERTILQARLKVKAIKEGKAVKCFRRTLAGDTYFGTDLTYNR